MWPPIGLSPCAVLGPQKWQATVSRLTGLVARLPMISASGDEFSPRRVKVTPLFRPEKTRKRYAALDTQALRPAVSLRPWAPVA